MNVFIIATALLNGSRPAASASIFGLRASSDFKQFANKKCRAVSGTNDVSEILRFNKVSVGMCKDHCRSEPKCFGFEYTHKQEKCDIRKEDIDQSNLKYDHAKTCYVNKKMMTGVSAPAPKPKGSFKRFSEKKCRTTSGTNNPSEIVRFKPVSVDACKANCKHEPDCFGFEYTPQQEKCEIWKEEIDEYNLRPDDNKICYIKKNSASPPTRSPPRGFKKFGKKKCRTSQGRNASEIVRFKPVSVDTCKANCKSEQNCFGFEFTPHQEKCDIWKEAIEENNLRHDYNKICYINMKKNG